MNNKRDILAEAMDNLDEKYVTKTAKSFIDNDESTASNVSLNAEDFIEIKMSEKKSRPMAKFAAAAAAFVCVATVSGVVAVNSNRTPVQTYSENVPETSVIETTAETTVKPETTSPTGNGGIYTGEFMPNIAADNLINVLTKIDDNTLLAITDGPIWVIDAENYEIIKRIKRPGGSIVYKIDNGFVVINPDYDNCYFELFDVKGNVTKHVELPTIPADFVEGATYSKWPTAYPYSFRVSTDGKSVVYYGDNGLCVNSIDLDNEVVLQPAEEFNGGFEEFYQMPHIDLFKDGVMYGAASIFNAELDENELYFASLDTTTMKWTIYGEIKDRQQLFSQDEFTEDSFMIVDAGADCRKTEGKLRYFTLGDTEMKEFTCNNTHDSVRAFISDNAKYILTTHYCVTGLSETKLYDVETGEVLWSKETVNHAQTAYIDEESRTLHVVLGTVLIVVDF